MTVSATSIAFWMHRALVVWSSGGPLGPSDIDPDDARDVACDVTAPGRVCSPGAPRDREFDPPDSSTPAFAGLVGQILVLVLVAVLVVAVVWLVSRFLAGSTVDDDGDGHVDDVDESIDEPVDARVVDHETPPDRWRRRAVEARERSDHREAIRCEYRALVGDLARAGHVDEIPGRTSGEERDQISELAPAFGERGEHVATQFSTAADIFDAAWFDDAVVDSDDDDRFVAASRSVLDVVLGGSVGARVGRRRG